MIGQNDKNNDIIIGILNAINLGNFTKVIAITAIKLPALKRNILSNRLIRNIIII